MRKQISVKGLADFMAASAVRQRSIVREYKYPKEDESRAKILYYREARDRVVAHHSGGHVTSWLTSQASAIGTLALTTPKGRSRIRLQHNARGLEQYAAHFGTRTFQVLDDLKLELIYGDVRVTVVPDLHVREKGKPKIIKLGFGVAPPPPVEVQVISQGMFEAAEVAGLGLGSSDVLFFDVPRGTVHRGARVGSRMRANIEAACHTLSDIWDAV